MWIHAHHIVFLLRKMFLFTNADPKFVQIARVNMFKFPIIFQVAFALKIRTNGNVSNEVFGAVFANSQNEIMPLTPSLSKQFVLKLGYFVKSYLTNVKQDLTRIAGIIIKNFF